MITDPIAPAAERLSRGPLFRLLSPLLAANLALFSTYLGAAAVLLPTQVAGIDPDPVRKALNLSIVTGSAAVVALLAQPLTGALSDRSGRRNPWIAGFGLSAAAGTLWVAGAGSIVLLVGVWCLVTVLLNGFQAVITAVVPDRVPRGQRGVASAFVGVATPVAAIVGVGSASRLIDRPALAYAVFGLMVAGSAVLFVTLNPERRRPRAEVVPIRGQLLTAANALRHRDFLLAFLSRAAAMMAYLIVFHYLLFILESRVRLPARWEAADALAVLTVIAGTAMVTGTVVGGLLSDRLRRYRLFVVIAATLLIVAAVPPILSTGLPAMIVYVSVMGLGFGCFLAVDTAIATLVLPRADDAARDMGILNIANAAPQTLAAFVAGLVVAALGGGPDAYAALFVASIGFAAVSGLVILGIRGVR
ncbi:MFS transporter [Dactylosporangium sp. CA-092794]|uniref:MFS transporter n=1 Tax=Dactylosporangium sp. CA-092794 TaxID=3239929 RepID=UPI003D8C3570